MDASSRSALDVGADIARIRQRHRRTRRLSPPRVRSDPHPSLPDALPRPCRRSAAARVVEAPRVAARGRSRPRHAARVDPARGARAAPDRHDQRADDGDGARHGHRTRDAGRARHPRDRRQMSDGSRRRRAELVCTKTAAAGSTRALRCGSAGTVAANGRLRTALAPRFAVSCTRELLEEVARRRRRRPACSSTRTPLRIATR